MTKNAKTLRVKGLAAPFEVARARQKHMNLRINPRSGTVHVTVPYYTSNSEIENFIKANRDWLQGHIAQIPPHIPFDDGAEIPLLGARRILRHTEGQIGIIDEGTRLLIGGDIDFMERRLRDYLIGRARREITMRARYYAAQLSKRIAAITIRDTTSRWGSCSTGGRLSFSWRLVMAPLYVLDYVVAHEVAHLVHMNHSPAFWSLVEDMVGDHEAAKKWLVQHGAKLMRYGSVD